MNPMKRTTLILFVLCNIFICRLSANADISYFTYEEPHNVDLYGDLIATGTRSLSLYLYPIILVQDNDLLETIIVGHKLGEITIRIFDNMNKLLYQESINTDEKKTFVIQPYNLKNGKYQIKFMNSQGKYLKGEFVIQR